MDGSGLFMLLIVVVALFFYFLPTIIAVNRSNRNVVAIAALNLLVGWTFIGWVVSLVWALTQDASTRPASPTI